MTKENGVKVLTDMVADFVAHIGKKLPDDAKYCDACGTIARSDEKEQSSYSKDSTTYQSNNDHFENTESPFTNAAYNLGVTQAQNGYIEQPISCLLYTSPSPRD